MPELRQINEEAAGEGIPGEVLYRVRGAVLASSHRRRLPPATLPSVLRVVATGAERGEGEVSDLFWASDDGKAELWLADSLDPESVAAVMGERKADALIVDAPYSARTHEAHEAGRMTPEQLARWANRDTSSPRFRERAYARRAGKRRSRRSGLEYSPWAAEDVERFVDAWSPLCSGWLCSLTDHSLFPHWESSMGVNDRVTFQPLPFVETGSRVRMCGDGPSSWSCWLAVGRPKGQPYCKWGALRGAYVMPGERAFNGVNGSDRIVGGKPLRGMLLIVEDYSRHGDLVVDPCCGAGTTGVASRTLGRRFIGIDNNREHAEIAVRRISEAREQVVMPMGDGAEAHQTTMFPAACGTKGE
jgi:hypothetical protein